LCDAAKQPLLNARVTVCAHHQKIDMKVGDHVQHDSARRNTVHCGGVRKACLDAVPLEPCDDFVAGGSAARRMPLHRHYGDEFCGFDDGQGVGHGAGALAAAIPRNQYANERTVPA